MSKEKVYDDGLAPTHTDVEGASSPTQNPEYNLAAGHDQLERGLKSRHIQFLALGKRHPLPRQRSQCYPPRLAP